MSIPKDPGTEIIWTTEEGEEVELDRMGAGHLLSTYRMLKRQQDRLATEALAFGTHKDVPAGLARVRLKEYGREIRAAQEKLKPSLDMLRAEIERRNLLILL